MTTNDKAMELVREIFDALDEGILDEDFAADLIRPHLKPEWMPIETAGGEKGVLAYFPPTDDKHPSNRRPEMIEVTHPTGHTHRKPTHWQPLPEPPKGDDR